MKLKLFLIMLGIILWSAALAQPPGGQGQQFDPEQMVKRQTEQMVTDLGLNADQTKKVEALNRKYGEKMGELFRSTTPDGDRSAMREKMTALRTEKNNELKAVLTEAQMKKYLELEEQRMSERRQQMQGSRDDAPGRRGQPRGTGN
jgi:Spy/CpxP family protein refolding chaperone